MPDVLIIGGGFAGVWSAMAAARLHHEHAADLSVCLVTPDDYLTIRPRLYQASPAGMRVALDRILAPIGVRRIAGTAVTVDTRASKVVVAHSHGSDAVGYRRLVLAPGSVLVRPDLPGNGHLFDVDSIAGAVALESHLHELAATAPEDGQLTAVVIGAGFTGLEVATTLTGRLRALAGPCAGQVRVVLIDQAPTVGSQLGPAPRPIIEAALDQLGVEVRLNVSVASINATQITLTDKTVITTRTVIWTAGMRAHALGAQIPGRHDHLGVKSLGVVFRG